MDKLEIEDWLWEARREASSALGLEPGWWPITAGDGQARASAWALAFFLRAAGKRCVGTKLEAHCHANAKGSGKAGPMRSKLMLNCWNGPKREHSPKEVLVDFSVHNWNAANPIQLTGEAEVGPSHGVGDSLTELDDYSWDFYKLLLIPSATRLFVARVGSYGDSAEERVEKLSDTLVGLIDLYAPALLRHHDELGAVIIPAKKSAASVTRILWLERGRLRCEVAEQVPDLTNERKTGVI